MQDARIAVALVLVRGRDEARMQMAVDSLEASR